MAEMESCALYYTIVEIKIGENNFLDISKFKTQKGIDGQLEQTTFETASFFQKAYCK